MSDKFAISEAKSLFLLEQLAFGSLFTDNPMQVSHLPYITKGDDAIEVHLANSNPQLANIDGKECLFSVLGPHTFISTDLYISKPAVPTWNYASVTVHGYCEVMTSAETAASLDLLLERLEPSLLTDKETLPDAVRENLMAMITGVRIHIEHLHGKAKLGQNRPPADQKKVYDTLRTRGETKYTQFVKAWLNGDDF